MLQCVLYIFLGGAFAISSGCIPYPNAVTIDRVEYVDSYPAATYPHSERIPMGYTLHRSKAPMRYHADYYDWYLYRGQWYKRPIGISGYRYRHMRSYHKHRARHHARRPVLPKKVFAKPKPKKRYKPKKKHKKRYKRTCHVW